MKTDKDIASNNVKRCYLLQLFQNDESQDIHLFVPPDAVTVVYLYKQVRRAAVMCCVVCRCLATAS